MSTPTAPEPAPNSAPAADGQPNAVPPEPVAGSNNGQAKPFDAISFGAGVTKGRSEAEKSYQEKIGKVEADFKAQIAQLEAKNLDLIQLSNVRDTMQAAYIHKRIEVIPEKFRGIVSRKVEAGDLSAALTDLADLEGFSIPTTPPVPKAGPVVNDIATVPLGEFQHAVNTRNTKRAAELVKQYGAEAFAKAEQAARAK